jgi:hypothetical protein
VAAEAELSLGVGFKSPSIRILSGWLAVHGLPAPDYFRVQTISRADPGNP